MKVVPDYVRRPPPPIEHSKIEDVVDAYGDHNPSREVRLKQSSSLKMLSSENPYQKMDGASLDVHLHGDSLKKNSKYVTVGLKKVKVISSQ